MFRYNTHKQAFIMAALIILLCLVCLTGATLALFTSNHDDGTIGIVTTSGDVEIDIVDTSGVTLQEKSLEFVTSDGVDTFYFEPGATFYTQGFQVKNTGTVTVQYRLSVSEKVDEKEFYEAFDVWIVRAEDPNFADAEQLTAFKGVLVEGESSETYCLFIKMKETAGNEFQGKTYSGIGVTVYAIQSNATIKE